VGKGRLYLSLRFLHLLGKGFAVVAFRAGAVLGMRLRFTGILHGRLLGVGAGALPSGPLTGWPRHPWRNQGCRTGLETNSCGTCTWRGWLRGTQVQYLSLADLFFKVTWLSAEAVGKRDVQRFLVPPRDRDVARETLRGYRLLMKAGAVIALVS